MTRLARIGTGMPVPIKSHVTPELRQLFNTKAAESKTANLPMERRTVKISSLKLDASYRGTNPKPEAVTDLAVNWQDSLYTPIMVVQRGRHLFIIRGLRRALAAILTGRNEIEAFIIQSQDAEHELSLLETGAVRTQIKHQRALASPVHPSHALAKELQRICDAVGVKIAEHQAPGVLTGTERMMDAITNYGSAQVEHALRLYRKIWARDRVHAYVTSGLTAWLYAVKDIPHVSDDRIITAFQRAFHSHGDAITAQKSLNTNRRHTDLVYSELFTRKYNETMHGRAKLKVETVINHLTK